MKEQNLYIVGIQESIEDYLRTYTIETKTFTLNELTNESSVWELSDIHLTEEQFDFTFNNQRYSLNRYWQVLGTEIVKSPVAQPQTLSRHIFYFGNHLGGDEDASLRFDELVDLINANEEDGGSWWKNIPLLKELMHYMKDFPFHLDLNYCKEIIYTIVKEQMIDEYNTPRLLLSFMNYFHVLDRSLGQWKDPIGRLLKLIDPNTPPKEAVELMGNVKKDPIQLTPKWEEIIYEVQEECDERLKDVPRHRGFCHKFWGVMKEVLAEKGMEWKSPGLMNPRIRFD